VKKNINNKTCLFYGRMISLCCFVAIIIYKTSDVKIIADEWDREKKRDVVSCGLFTSIYLDDYLNQSFIIVSSDKSEQHEIAHDSPGSCPGPDPKNGNGCSHQPVSLCETNNSKRKIFKIYHC
jgi:hypothetical protein